MRSWTQKVRCRVCDQVTTGPCTNGLCRRCHGQHCTDGGITYPGHGLDIKRALRLHHEKD